MAEEETLHRTTRCVLCVDCPCVFDVCTPLLALPFTFLFSPQERELSEEKDIFYTPSTTFAGRPMFFSSSLSAPSSSSLFPSVTGGLHQARQGRQMAMQPQQQPWPEQQQQQQQLQHSSTGLPLTLLQIAERMPSRYNCQVEKFSPLC